jgi:Iodothyronine deiodinase
VAFLTVYVSEAHPEDEWQMESNREDNVLLNQPKIFEERREAARILVERLKYDLPLAIDSMDNKAEAAYAAWPERLYVVAAGGRVVYRGGLGPFGFDPHEMEKALAAHLAGARASAR